MPASGASQTARAHAHVLAIADPARQPPPDPTPSAPLRAPPRPPRPCLFVCLSVCLSVCPSLRVAAGRRHRSTDAAYIHTRVPDVCPVRVPRPVGP
eukprot:3026611-Prymnesium_polylepis.1